MDIVSRIIRVKLQTGVQLELIDRHVYNVRRLVGL